jgi:hypothetical protein
MKIVLPGLEYGTSNPENPSGLHLLDERQGLAVQPFVCVG